VAEPADPRRSERKGLMRRLNLGKKGSVAIAFSAAEELFGPTKRDARIVVEQQRRVGRRAPSPTDPPDLATGADATDADRFAGKIVINSKPSR
jgi:hypothetical protein